jgi:hypothetical protein
LAIPATFHHTPTARRSGIIQSGLVENFRKTSRHRKKLPSGMAVALSPTTNVFIAHCGKESTMKRLMIILTLSMFAVTAIAGCHASAGIDAASNVVAPR